MHDLQRFIQPSTFFLGKNQQLKPHYGKNHIKLKTLPAQKSALQRHWLWSEQTAQWFACSGWKIAIIACISTGFHPWRYGEHPVQWRLSDSQLWLKLKDVVVEVWSDYSMCRFLVPHDSCWPLKSIDINTPWLTCRRHVTVNSGLQLLNPFSWLRHDVFVCEDGSSCWPPSRWTEQFLGMLKPSFSWRC